MQSFNSSEMCKLHINININIYLGDTSHSYCKKFNMNYICENNKSNYPCKYSISDSCTVNLFGLFWVLLLFSCLVGVRLDFLGCFHKSYQRCQLELVFIWAPHKSCSAWIKSAPRLRCTVTPRGKNLSPKSSSDLHHHQCLGYITGILYILMDCSSMNMNTQNMSCSSLSHKEKEITVKLNMFSASFGINYLRLIKKFECYWISVDSAAH